LTLCFSLLPCPPTSPLFPYTTLFRSHFIPQFCCFQELHFLGCFLHTFSDSFNRFLHFLLTHIFDQWISRHGSTCFRLNISLRFAFKVCHGGLFQDLLFGLPYGPRRNAMLQVISNLLIPSPVGFINGHAHTIRHLIRIHDHPAFIITCRTTDGLDQGSFRAQEAFLICIQDGH